MFWRKKKTNSLPFDDVASFGYDVATKFLVVRFYDGTSRTHINVGPGFVVGLEVAAHKRDYYDTQIAHRFTYVARDNADDVSDTDRQPVNASGRF